MMVWEENLIRKALWDDERMESASTRHIFSIKRILEICWIVHLIAIVVIQYLRNVGGRTGFFIVGIHNHYSRRK